ncbi:MAG: radical SAM protein [Desulfobacteraceae bacterium 4484_190.3]|nr:MAG: radical SAM protein [Desulfobacteraceae bacterium 4484_190.3]
MKTVSSLLDEKWYKRYRLISRLNIRSSIYDVTNRCNLRCSGCFFFSSNEHKVAKEEMSIKKWERFIEREKERGVNLAILIGGEPTLCLDRVEAFYRRMPTMCASNGLIKVPRDRFPDMLVGISLWGDEEDEKILRGKDTFAVSSKNYEGDPNVYYLYTITPGQIGRTEKIIKKIKDVGLKIHMQLFSNDENIDGFFWDRAKLDDIRLEMDDMLDKYPDIFISSKYYHEIITTGKMLGRSFGWKECPSVTEPLDNRRPSPKRLIGFIRWASDLKVMVNKRAHMNSGQDLRNWIEIYEMFAKLYRFIPW